mmetsp:Transcript_659/g.1333  ORF Transcript_659/g.1333 Transcript_659/m.1333 type:complete len:389 (+) Transcript_659:3-1169(+)
MLDLALRTTRLVVPGLVRSTAVVLGATGLDGHRDVISVQDLQSSLQRLNFLLPLRHALLVGHPGIHAAGPQLLVVRLGSLQLGGSRLQLLLLALEILLHVCLLRLQVVDVRLLDSLVVLGFVHVILVLTLGLRFAGLSIRLQADEVRLDHLQHANNAAGLRLHTLVGLRECLRGILGDPLGQGSGACGALVKVLDDGQRILHSGLGLLRILDGLRVLRLLLVALLGGPGHVRLQSLHSVIEIANLGGGLGNPSGQLLHLALQCLHGSGLGVAGVLVGGQLRGAPPLLLRFFVGLLHQPHNQVGDQLLHFAEWIVSCLLSRFQQLLAPDALGGGLEVLQGLAHLGGGLDPPELHQGRGGLRQSGQVLVGSAGHRGAGQDVHSLLNRLDL